MPNAVAAEALSHHYDDLIRSLTDGLVVPFLGAGVNRCGRPAGKQWEPAVEFLPDGKELAKYLATKFGYPGATKEDLLRVSQFVAVMQGNGELHKRLRDVLDRDFPVTPVHDFLAKLPKDLQNKSYRKCHQLILTTNYDDVLERAFIAAGEPYDLVVYEAAGLNRGKFIHYPHDGKPKVIDKPNKYAAVSPDIRSVILKIHGAVERRKDAKSNGSYVITEDDYIDYLTRSDPSELIPVRLLEKLRNSHLLFLGYGLQDWNLRVILRSIAQEDGRLGFKGWAVQLDPDDLDRKFWANRDVDIFNVRLEDYIQGAGQRLAGWTNV